MFTQYQVLKVLAFKYLLKTYLRRNVQPRRMVIKNDFKPL